MAILPVRLCMPFAALLVRSTSTTAFHRPLATRVKRKSVSILHMASSSSSTAVTKKQPVVQYIFLRRDLEDWPAGAVAALAAHVSVAAIVQATAADSAAAAEYVTAENLPHMTKYVYGVDTLQELRDVRHAWNEQIRLHSNNKDDKETVVVDRNDETSLESYWWVEQPENIPTAFATWPVIRTNKVSKVVKKLGVSYF